MLEHIILLQAGVDDTCLNSIKVFRRKIKISTSSSVKPGWWRYLLHRILVMIEWINAGRVLRECTQHTPCLRQEKKSALESCFYIDPLHLSPSYVVKVNFHLRNTHWAYTTCWAEIWIGTLLEGVCGIIGQKRVPKNVKPRDRAAVLSQSGQLWDFHFFFGWGNTSEIPRVSQRWWFLT